MRTFLFIGQRFGGGFDSPLDLVGNTVYFCRFCGEIFAKRIVEKPDAMWDYISGTCRACPKSIPYGAWQSFTLPGEAALGFEPSVLLAEEFLFNTGVPV